jgi:AcrR family transcriptional regulator
MNNVESLVQIPETPVEDGAAPRSADWENPRVAAILAAAAKCFARKGFSATTLAEIGKELGLRKSIVHYYFASKAALIHEVQSFSYHKYLNRVKDAVLAGNGTGNRAVSALVALWDAIQSNRTLAELNIEVWSAARRDEELKRRASALQREAEQLIAEGVRDALGQLSPDASKREALATLILAVLNGLSIAQYLEGDAARSKAAYEAFLHLLKSELREIPSA